MAEDDWRRTLSEDDVGAVGACLSAAADGPFFPDWEFSTLFGFERSEVAGVAASWPETDDLDYEYRVVSSSLNNLLGYPHGVSGTSWDEWIPRDRDRLEALFSDIRERSGANDRMRERVASQIATFERLDTDELIRSGRIVGDMVIAAERLGVEIPSSVAVFGAAVSFGDEARAFCQFVERGLLSLDELQTRLSSLVEKAERLPMVEPTEDDYDDPDDLDASCRTVASRIGELAGKRAFYELPGDRGEPVIGDLRDDVFDIYRDLRRGEAIAAVNHVDGVWALRFSFDTHWGEHARAAVAAIAALDDGLQT